MATSGFFYSALNSSSTPLSSSAAFTGSATNVSGFASAKVSYYADVAGSLSIQQSSDGSNWDHERPITVGADAGGYAIVGIHSSYFRVVYTNGGTNQTAFRLQTSFQKATGEVAAIHPSLDSLTFDGDNLNVKLADPVTLAVALDKANDSVAVWGSDDGGTTMRILATDASGNAQVDVLTQPARASGTDSIDAVQSGTWSVRNQDGSGNSLSSTSNALHVHVKADDTVSGHSIARGIDLDESADTPSTSAGTLYMVQASNLDSANYRFVKVYDKASAATDADTPIATIPVGPDASVCINFSGVALSNGLSLRATTGIADNDTGAPGANEVLYVVEYA